MLICFKQWQRDKERLAKICAILNFVLWTLLLVLYITIFSDALQYSAEKNHKYPTQLYKSTGPRPILGDLVHLNDLADRNSEASKTLYDTFQELELEHQNIITAVILVYFASVNVFSIVLAIFLLLALQKEAWTRVKVWLYASCAIFISDTVMITLSFILEGCDAFLLLKLLCHIFSCTSICITRVFVREAEILSCGHDPRVIEKMPYPVPVIVVCDYDCDMCESNPSPVIASFPKSSIEKISEDLCFQVGTGDEKTEKSNKDEAPDLEQGSELNSKMGKVDNDHLFVKH